MQSNPVDSPQKSVMTDSISKLTSLCARHAWITTLLITLSAAACVYYTVDKLKFKTDRADLIDPSAPFFQRWLRYTKTFGESDDIVIIVEGE